MADGFQLERYLKRIGHAGATRPDLPTLHALHSAHASAIPFEGLDPLLQRPVKLDLAAVQEKLVKQPRGGYCFEQNALFKAALDAIGFKTVGLTGRVRWMSPPGSPLGPRLHMLLKVETEDGPYLADVGFGVCVLDAPLKFEMGIEQRTAMGVYRLMLEDGLISLSARRGDGWRTMYVFDLEPQLQSDFELGNWFASTSPDVPFTNILILERVTKDRRYRMKNRTLTIEARDGEIVEQVTARTSAQLEKILGETFGVTAPVPIVQFFDRIGD